MAKLTLTYFDFDGGRGEPPRLALAIGGIPFEDRRIAGASWPTMKATMPLHALPVLDVDGQLITQSNAILRYVGRLANLYPNDPWQAALCDEVLDAVEDVSSQIAATITMPDAGRKKEARERLAAGPIPVHLARLQTLLQQRGDYFADGRLTIADLKVFMWVRWLRSGALDHIPKDIVERLAPALVQHFERINGHPAISAYYDKRRAAKAA